MQVPEKNIQDFIYFMTHNKNLTRDQKKKRDLLLGKSVTNRPNNEPEAPVSQKSATNRLKYISPSNLVKFLKRYNGDEILKYTSHDIDSEAAIKLICELCDTSEYNLRKHSDLISKRFDSLIAESKERREYIRPEIYARFSSYLKGGMPWSANSVDFNWASEDLLKWGDENPNIIPTPGENLIDQQNNDGYKLSNPLVSSIGGNRILFFTDLVKYFKSLFHIRHNNSLKAILEYFNSKNPMTENVDITFSEKFADNIELFTDVEILLKAYKKIIYNTVKLHKETKERTKIELSFEEDGKYKYLTIHDVDSVYQKSVYDSTNRIGKEYQELIRTINGICDLYVEADFGNENYYRLSIWHEKSKELVPDNPNITKTEIEPCRGVKHILKFYTE